VGLTLALNTTGCFAYSSYQSARIVEADKPQVTIASSRSQWLRGDDVRSEWWVFEFQARQALSKRSEIGGKLSILASDGGDTGGALFGIDLKRGLLGDYVALDLPFGVYVPVIHSLHVYPGVIVTLPLHERLEINLAAKTFYFFTGNTDKMPLFAYNVGLGLKPGRSGFVIRPEIGWMTAADPRDSYMQFGIGIDLPHDRDTEPARSSRASSVPEAREPDRAWNLSSAVHAIQPGTPLRVQLPDSLHIEGRLARADSNAFYIESAGQTVAVQLTQIEALWARESAAGKGATTGGRVLGTAGAVWGALAVGIDWWGRSDPPSTGERLGAALVGGFAGYLIGNLVGGVAAAPFGTWQQVYPPSLEGA
jgi:hypothetical protein